MWVMLGEMFPNQIRGSALAVAGLRAVDRQLRDLGQLPGAGGRRSGLAVTYSFYALSALVSFFFVQRMVHETRGRELEDMVG